MHAQLGALSALVALVDPQLAAFLKTKDADNYFFCYRWLLIYFKRDFAFDEASTARQHPDDESCSSLCCSTIRIQEAAQSSDVHMLDGKESCVHWVQPPACICHHSSHPTASQLHFYPAHL